MKKIVLLLFISVILSSKLFAANYYWRAVAVNGSYTNIVNWETSPGGGLSPATAPGINDDVYFPIASNFSVIDFNGGNCRNFTVTAPSPATFTFGGTLTSITGSIDWNGRVSLANPHTINFNAPGSATINVGTASSVSAGGSWNFSGAITGNYALTGPLNAAITIIVSGPGFNTAGYDLSCNVFNISGNTTKTINFSNSLITLNNPGVFITTSSNATTTYNTTNSRVIFNSNAGAPGAISIGSAIQVGFDSLTFTTPTGNGTGSISLSGNAKITANVLKVDVKELLFGGALYDLASSGSIGQLSLGKLLIAKPGLIYAADDVTMSVGAIEEAFGACGSSIIMANGIPLKLNTTAAFSTSKTSYYNIAVGGSGLNGGSVSNNLGFNSGAISFGGPVAGSTTFWWVGGTGNWNDPTRWSIAGSGGTPQSVSGCLPSLQDDVVFDANSFTGAQTVTIPTGYDALCRNLDWSAGSNQGTLLAANQIISGGTAPPNLFINGSANFSKAAGVNTNMVYIGSGTHTITSGTVITYAGRRIYFKGSGIYTLSDNLKGNPATTAVMHNAGTFITNGKTVDVAGFQSSSLPYINTNLRNLNITNSELVLNIAGSVDVSYLSSLAATNSLIKLTGTGIPGTASTWTVLRSNAASPFLATINFNNVSFTNKNSQAFFVATPLVGATINYNDVSFAGNGDITGSGFVAHNVNNYNLTGGYTYTFTSFASGGSNFNVLNAINNVLSPCQDFVVIKSSNSGLQARLNKASGTFNINSALVKDINAIGVTMNVTGGVDGGNNTNVIAGAVAGRTMYWVDNTGNWSDGANHWSINVSGGNPAITNPNGCIPRIIDSVVFDNNSFNLSSQTVTLDVDANCKGMMWTSDAGTKSPILAGANTRFLNNYGCLEFGKGMTTTFNGNIFMYGSGTGVNNNYIDANGVTIAAGLSLYGGGRYDLADSIKITGSNTGGNGLELFKGNFVANGNKIVLTNTLSLSAADGNSSDISNTFISAAYLLSKHNAIGGSAWKADGSTIEVVRGASVNNTIPVTYNNIKVIGQNTSSINVGIATSATQAVTFNKIVFDAPFITTTTDQLNGLMIADTLQTRPSKIITLVPGGGREYLVNDTIIAYGTPCNPSFIRSATLGTPALIKRTICNTDFNFVNLRDISFGSCTVAQNKVIGTDEGGNSNVTITGIPALAGLGADTTVLCKDIPYIQRTNGFGNIPGMTYLWNTGATSSTLSINNSNTYSVAVTYAPGCNVSDSRIVNVGPTPPVTMPLTYQQLSNTYCSNGGYNYYDGAVASTTNNKSILALSPNGNTITPSSITVNNEGNLTGASGTFSNTGNGYYQSTDFAKTIRVSKRLHSVVAPGSYTTNGGVIVRVYYEDADLASIATDAWPDGLTVAAQGWFKHTDHTAQDVVNKMTPGYLTGGSDITPVASGTEGGVKYVEFKVTSFSTFGYYAKTTPFTLPVTLISFNAASENCKVKLNWKTAEEISFSHFEIERSNDGVSYSTIGTVNANGNNSNYSYVDNTPKEGKNIYRLKMIDADGKYKYSSLKLVTFSCNGVKSIMIYPNPAIDNINISISGYTKQVQGKLYNAIGQLQKTAVLVNGTNSITVNGLANGVYNLVITEEAGSNIPHKIIVQH